MLTCDLTTLEIESISVTVARRETKPPGNMSVLFEPTQLFVAGNITP